MDCDIKELIGAVMRVLGGGEISRKEVEELMFDADGDLLRALNEAYIQLLEFAYDTDARRTDVKRDREMRDNLQVALNEIIRLTDSAVSSN